MKRESLNKSISDIIFDARHSTVKSIYKRIFVS